MNFSYLQNRNKKVQKLLSAYSDNANISSGKEKDLLEVLDYCEEMALAVRNDMKQSPKQLPQTSDIPFVETEKGEHYVLVKTPQTLRRQFKKSYGLANYVGDKLADIDLFHYLTPPLSCFIVRRVTETNNLDKDADNVEVHSIFNLIFAKCGYDDGVQICPVFVSSEVVYNKNETLFVVCEEDYLFEIFQRYGLNDKSKRKLNNTY